MELNKTILHISIIARGYELTSLTRVLLNLDKVSTVQIGAVFYFGGKLIEIGT